MAYDPRVGNQYTVFEEPDIIIMNLRGNVLPEEAAEMGRRHQEWAVGRDSLYFLINANGLEKLEPESRRIASATMRTMPVHGLAVHSAPLKSRVLVKLVLTALKLFRSDTDQSPTEFHDTEDEARRWIESRRREIAAGQR